MSAEPESISSPNHSSGIAPQRARFAPMVIAVCILGGLWFLTTQLASATGSDEKLQVASTSYWAIPNDGAKLPAPRGLFAAPEHDELYVLDNAGRVLVFNGAGDVVKQWRMPESEIGRPEGVCRFKDGRVVVADTHYDRVVFFDEDGEVLKLMGTHGREPGQFVYPVAVTQDDSENFYIAEYGDCNRVQKFDVEGNFLLEFGSHGEGEGQFQRPCGMAWHDGMIFVVDAFNNRIQKFTDEGKFLGYVGQSNSPASGSAGSVGAADNLPELDYPYDIARCPDGRLFVVEYKAGRLTGFTKDGELLGRFGSPGRGKSQMSTPWGLTAWSNNRLFVADTGNRRIVEIKL